MRRATVLGLCGVLSWPALARADGAFPDALSVILPADRPHEITLATNFGLVISNDDGASWSWTCESDATNNGYLYQIGPTPQDRFFALSGDGKLVYSDDGACTWAVAAGAVGSGSAVDVFPDPVDATRVLAIVSPDGRPDGQTNYTLVVSHDGGAHFDRILEGAKSEELTGVEVPRLDATKIYLTATSPPSTPALMRSTDAGATWSNVDLGAGFQASEIRIVAIDRDHPAQLFLRSTLANGDGLTILDETGAVRTPVVIPNGRLTAFAHLAAGPFLVAGLADDDKQAVLFRSTDGSTSFAPIAGAPHLRALGERDGVLYGATDHQLDGFALASSRDQGATWQTVMQFDHVTAIRACVRDTCQSSCVTEANLALWPAAICGPSALHESLADASTVADGSGADGSREEAGDVLAASASGGCCAARDGSKGFVWVAVALLLSFVRRRRGRTD
jgi:hypothetical protein